MEQVRQNRPLASQGRAGVADEGLNRIGAMLEELGARFELVVEAVSGFGGKVDKMKEEIFGQFAEVGSQIRFISDQIGESRSGVNALRSDFGAEMVRLNETIGRTRVEFREQVATSEANLRGAISSQSVQEVAASEASSNGQVAVSEDLGRDVAESLKKLSAEIKQTNKAVANLSRKFERFDDRMTVQVKDQDQRLKKVEGGGRRR
jgi:archaellum component FlaC